MLSDQVDQRAEERQDDEEDHPCGLAPAGDVAPAKEVGEDDDEDPDPRNPREEQDHGPEDVEERIIGGYKEHRETPFEGG